MRFETTKLLLDNISYKGEIPKRSPIYIGFRCQQKCKFCYYLHLTDNRMFSLDQVKQQVDNVYSLGITDFELTGGEPGQHDQLIDICKHIKSKNKNNKVSIVTNGDVFKFGDDLFNIIDEVLISYHIPKSVSSLVSSKDIQNIFGFNCTYSKMQKTAALAKAHNCFLRFNIIVMNENCNLLNDILDEILQFNPNIINFLPMNFFEHAYSIDKCIDLDLIAEKIKTAIDKMLIASNCQPYIRYFPFCKMQGYEQYVLNNLQHIFDWFDWNKSLSLRQPKFLLDGKDISKTKIDAISQIVDVLDACQYTYSKPFKCMKCKYFFICDGIQNRKYSHNIEIEPVIGEKIKDILAFFKTNKYIYDAFYKKGSQTC